MDFSINTPNMQPIRTLLAKKKNSFGNVDCQPLRNTDFSKKTNLEKDVFVKSTK